MTMTRRRRHDAEDTIVATSRYSAGDSLNAYRSRLSLNGYSFHITSDDWYPSFNAPPDGEGGLVGCKIIVWPKSETVRVYFCGGDDTVVYRDDFTLDEARAFVLRLPSIISRAWLATQGFADW